MHENTVKSPKLSESFTSVIKMFVLSRSFYLLIPNQVSLWEKNQACTGFQYTQCVCTRCKNRLKCDSGVKKNH